MQQSYVRSRERELLLENERQLAKLRSMEEAARISELVAQSQRQRQQLAQDHALQCITALSEASLVVSNAVQESIKQLFLAHIRLAQLTADKVKNALIRLRAARAVSDRKISDSEIEELDYFCSQYETAMSPGGSGSAPGGNDPDRLSVYLKLCHFLTFGEICSLEPRFISDMVSLLSWLEEHSLWSDDMKKRILLFGVREEGCYFQTFSSFDPSVTKDILGMLQEIHALNLPKKTFETITLSFFSPQFRYIFPILIKLLPEMPILRTLFSDDAAQNTHPQWYDMFYRQLQGYINASKSPRDKEGFFETVIACLRKCVQLQVDPPTYILAHPNPLECIEALAIGLSSGINDISSFLERSRRPLALLKTFQQYPDSRAYGDELARLTHPSEAMEAFFCLRTHLQGGLPFSKELLQQLDAPLDTASILNVVTLYLEVRDRVELGKLYRLSPAMLHTLKAILVCLNEHQLLDPDFKNFIVDFLLWDELRQGDFELPGLHHSLMILIDCKRLDKVSAMLLFHLPKGARQRYINNVQLISDEAWHLRDEFGSVDQLFEREKDTILSDKVNTCIDEWCALEKHLMRVNLLERCVDKASFMDTWQRPFHQELSSETLDRLIDRYHELARLDQIVAMVETYYKTHQVGLPVIFDNGERKQPFCIQFKVELATGQLSFTPTIIVPEHLSEAVRRISSSVMTDEMRAQLEKRLHRGLLEKLAASSSQDISSLAEEIIQFNSSARRYLELHGEKALEKKQAHINMLQKNIGDCTNKLTVATKEWQTACRQALLTAQSTYQAPNPPWLDSHYPLARYFHPSRKPYLLASIVGVIILITSIFVPAMGLASLIIGGLLCAVVPVMLATFWGVNKWIDPKTKNNIDQVERNTLEMLKGQVRVSDTIQPFTEARDKLTQLLSTFKGQKSMAEGEYQTLEETQTELKRQWLKLFEDKVAYQPAVRRWDLPSSSAPPVSSCTARLFSQRSFEEDAELMRKDPIAWRQKHFEEKVTDQPAVRRWNLPSSSAPPVSSCTARLFSQRSFEEDAELMRKDPIAWRQKHFEEKVTDQPAVRR